MEKDKVESRTHLDEHMRKMANIAENLLAIPANEQRIGHLQVAIQTFMLEVIEEFDKLQKVAGLYRGI